MSRLYLINTYPIEPFGRRMTYPSHSEVVPKPIFFFDSLLEDLRGSPSDHEFLLQLRDDTLSLSIA